jgi:hypothetical protein
MATTTKQRADALARYDKLIATVPGVARKGDTMPYTSVNGNMSSYLTKADRLALRLPAGAREELIAKFKAKLCEAYGIVQKEYVEIPDALLGKTAVLAPYFAASFAYVSGLKPKPTKRPKRAATAAR